MGALPAEPGRGLPRPRRAPGDGRGVRSEADADLGRLNRATGAGEDAQEDQNEPLRAGARAANGAVGGLHGHPYSTKKAGI